VKKLSLIMPVIDPWGVRRVVVVREGENATAVTGDFCLAYNVSEWEDDEACVELARRAEMMMEQRRGHKVGGVQAWH